MVLPCQPDAANHSLYFLSQAIGTGFALQSCCLPKPTLHCGCVNQACLLKLKLTSRKHREIRNAADVVPGCKPRVTLRVDLQYDCAPGHISCGLCHVRCCHPAWSAPGGPEVRQDRNLALANDLVELLFVDFQRFANCGQLRPAGTAFSEIGKVSGRDAVGPTARRAISNQRHGSILGHK